MSNLVNFQWIYFLTLNLLKSWWKMIRILHQIPPKILKNESALESWKIRNFNWNFKTFKTDLIQDMPSWHCYWFNIYLMYFGYEFTDGDSILFLDQKESFKKFATFLKPFSRSWCQWDILHRNVDIFPNNKKKELPTVPHFYRQERFKLTWLCFARNHAIN